MTPHTKKQQLIDVITLLQVPGIGKGRYHKLVRHYKSASAALAAPSHEIEALSGFSHTLACAIKNEAKPEEAEKIYERIVALGWTTLTPDHAEYPTPLLTIEDHPPVLFRLGQPYKTEHKMIGIVGTRHATENGRRFAASLAGELARAGIVVVSGMAEGIDSAAHQGALDTGGMTIAVWGTPLNVVFPAVNRGLAKRIEESGAIYSEYYPGVEIDPSFFPERNRIISALSDGVVVVEAGKKSGALITAKFALEQGRELFAVPGAPHNDGSLGTNALIKQGAKLLTSIEDIFTELPRLKGEIKARQFQQIPDLTDMERQILEQLGQGYQQIDQLSRILGVSVAEIMEYLLALELKGLIEERSGKRYLLVD